MLLKVWSDQTRCLKIGTTSVFMHIYHFMQTYYALKVR